MKLDVFTITNSRAGSLDLPSQFQEPVRPDLVKRAVEAIQANTRQPYGAMPGAGQRHSAKISRRRRDYKTSYGIGISRVPRKIMSRSGTRMNWVGALSPGTVGGREAHPPKAGKVLSKKINLQEKRKAIRSAMAAVMSKPLVLQRGHHVPPTYPFALETRAESLSKTKDVTKTLQALGFGSELQRVSSRSIRPTRGKIRGRKYRSKHGPLIVVSGECSLSRSSINIPGIEVANVRSLNANLLAPGAVVGRATLFTQAALELLAKEQLFTKTPATAPSRLGNDDQKRDTPSANQNKKVSDQKR
ncbi:50S ribosomal protein L4 [Candidatus Woesearchaeota archaeon]|nr:50S ribosomal protein L4 [Candidatus Woesearchaeota archaeon]